MKYTPADIVKNKLFFTIPIYQRLFEWDSDNIETLLRDLYRSFSQTSDDYYIGMLTATKGTDELVDGQQRFTVMMLLGCILQHFDGRWKNFLKDGRARLHFASRPIDEHCLEQLIEIDKDSCRKLVENTSFSVENFENEKMADGVRTIAAYMASIGSDEVKAYASYIYDHMCFFITRLPNNYGALDLNKYFERMNSSGKNLEQHEILKVKLLRHLDGDISRYMHFWNLLADVDTPLIRKRIEDKKTEREADFRNRKISAFNMDLDSLISQDCDIINNLGKIDSNDNAPIGDIQESPDKPSLTSRGSRDSRCVLRFPQLLLQALYLTLPVKSDTPPYENRREMKDRIEDFFDTGNLLETFSKYLPYEGNAVSKEHIHQFLGLLLRCRLALDICFIRPMDYGYSLDMNRPEDDKELKDLLMLESMLYVSSSNFIHYRWFGWMMSLIESVHQIPEPQVLYDMFLESNDAVNPLPTYDALTYNDNVRYWFWRLDFHIWKHRDELFGDNPDFLKVANNYIFVRNRSIEHIAPQHPKTESMMQWNEDDKEDEVLMNSFGNLVMISQGLNSALSNASYEVKTAHVQSFCNGASGTIESLKLLYVHKKYRMWNRDTIKEHGKEMFAMLNDNLEKGDF